MMPPHFARTSAIDAPFGPTTALMCLDGISSCSMCSSFAAASAAAAAAVASFTWVSCSSCSCHSALPTASATPDTCTVESCESFGDTEMTVPVSAMIATVPPSWCSGMAKLVGRASVRSTILAHSSTSKGAAAVRRAVAAAAPKLLLPRSRLRLLERLELELLEPSSESESMLTAGPRPTISTPPLLTPFFRGAGDSSESRFTETFELRTATSSPLLRGADDSSESRLTETSELRTATSSPPASTSTCSGISTSMFKLSLSTAIAIAHPCMPSSEAKHIRQCNRS
mmetsp:Transcript_160578/g.283135  ORF Transcript_160578/g.283135 Transcript_160578/m.283135 type:complete len:285 (+) Transcript_160578:397-1251(+)